VSIDNTVSTSMRGFQVPPWTDLHVDWITRLCMEPGIGQDNHLAIKLGKQGVKMRTPRPLASFYRKKGLGRRA
jgi:hypothetical protein